MSEQRRHKRRHLIMYFKVFDRNTNYLLGNLVDITPEGMMLITETPIEPAIIYQLRMELPKGFSSQAFLEFDARSRWCNQDINPQYYVTGFQFLKVTQADAFLIEQLIEEYGFVD